MRANTGRILKPSGFVMLEVLVSLVLVTSVGVAILLWAESGVHSIMRVRDEYDRVAAIRMTEDALRTLSDPAKTQGEIAFESFRVKWQMKVLESSPQNGYPGGFGPYDISLLQYDYSTTHISEPGSTWFENTVIVARGNRVRSFKGPFS